MNAPTAPTLSALPFKHNEPAAETQQASHEAGLESSSARRNALTKTVREECFTERLESLYTRTGNITDINIMVVKSLAPNGVDTVTKLISRAELRAQASSLRDAAA